jgi:hypothetical protein
MVGTDLLDNDTVAESDVPAVEPSARPATVAANDLGLTYHTTLTLGRDAESKSARVLHSVGT